ncbi:MAG: cysteine synthase family protein [Victivallales bacterium]|nr:cysteine synthase family protein [Victivallales bacterium]
MTSSAKTIFVSVGNTPLLRLPAISRDLDGVELYAKAEYFNPTGSVKDRAARAMILDGVERGQLTHDKTIIDATSGNTGIAYAALGAAMGYKVTLCLPANATEERKKLMRLYGAEIIETDPLESSDGAYNECRRLVAEHPEQYFYPDQYNNDANWKAHFNGTAVEIWEQTAHRVTHFVAGTGTSGTFMGTSRGLKQLNPQVKSVLMQPDSPFHGLEGMKHMASTIHPGFFDESIADVKLEISTEEAVAMTRRLVREEAILVGISSGANVAAALKLAKTLRPGSVVVTVLCDNGNRYLSSDFWEEA